MLVAKHRVIPERPGMRRERCSQRRCSSWDELDFFFKEEKQTFYYSWTLGKENLTVWNGNEFSYFFTGS